MSENIAAVVVKMVSDLGSLSSDDERERAFSAARAILGMATPSKSEQAGNPKSLLADEDFAGVSGAGTSWIKRNGLSRDNLDQHFHIEDGKVSLVGEAIGRSKREQTINTYLLTGVGALLQGGKADFTDQAARDYCERLGCYDPGHHSTTMSQFGNLLTGSKAAGWKLTTPGLTAAAELLKSNVKASQ